VKVALTQRHRKIIQRHRVIFFEGRRDARMASPKREPHEPPCMIAHNLITKITVIVGRCDLLNESNHTIESARQIVAIPDIAESTVQELIEHQRTIEAEKRKAG
jgi:hypothetical protein